MRYIGTQILEAEKAYKYFMPGGRDFVVTDNQEIGEEEHQVLHECVAAERGYRIHYENGHTGWCPYDVFEGVYHQMRGMNFGLALEAAKKGMKISRAGWNGKGQYVELATGISYENSMGDIVNAEHAAIGNAALAFVGTSGVQLGWLASQADMLAEDWLIVEV